MTNCMKAPKITKAPLHKGETDSKLTYGMHSVFMDITWLNGLFTPKSVFSLIHWHTWSTDDSPNLHYSQLMSSSLRTQSLMIHSYTYSLIKRIEWNFEIKTCHIRSQMKVQIVLAKRPFITQELGASRSNNSLSPLNQDALFQFRHVFKIRYLFFHPNLLSPISWFQE